MTIARLDRDQARVQSLWVAISIAVFVVTLAVVRDVHVFERYRYTVAFVGVGALLLPLAPGHRANRQREPAVGRDRFAHASSRARVAKVLLVAFFAAYLVDKRELLTYGRIRIGRWFIPSLRDLGPLLLAWGMALVVLGYEKDVGTSLLFFGVFAAMLYIATRRGAYLIGTLLLHGDRGRVRLPRVRARPAARRQLAQPLDRRARPRLPDHPVVVHVRIGRGRRHRTRAREPVAHPQCRDRLRVRRDRRGARSRRHDRRARGVHAAGGKRLPDRGRRDAPVRKLFAAGIATILGFQAFLIIGGVTRVIPLTGITLPFVSYGGSSLVANFALLAILLRISDDSAKERADAGGDR